MKKFIVPLIALLVLGGCGSAPESDGPPERAALVEEELAAEADPAKALKDLGDVEQTITIAATLADRVQGPHITEESLENLKGDLTMSTITVQPPAPTELWLNFQVGARADYREQPVALRVIIYRDNEPIGQFDHVLGKHANVEVAREGIVLPNRDYQFNVLDAMTEIPETMLVHAEATAMLMPPGTDETTLDPATATVAEDQITQLLSNPVRINFVTGPAAE